MAALKDQVDSLKYEQEAQGRTITEAYQQLLRQQAQEQDRLLAFQKDTKERFEPVVSLLISMHDADRKRPIRDALEKKRLDAINTSLDLIEADVRKLDREMNEALTERDIREIKERINMIQKYLKLNLDSEPPL